MAPKTGEPHASAITFKQTDDVFHQRETAEDPKSIPCYSSCGWLAEHDSLEAQTKTWSVRYLP